MRPYINLTDEEVVTAITDTFAARSQIGTGGVAVVIAGEGRRVEYTPADNKQLSSDLRHLEYEARLRGLDIAGIGGAVAVEFR